MLRRWLVLVIGLILTGLATFAVLTALPRSYQARSQALVMLSPTAGSPDYATSPFIYLPNTLNLLAQVATADLNTARFRAEMAQERFSARYEVAVEPQTSIVRFSVEGQDPALVQATHQELLRRFESELRRVQVDERVPPRQMAHARFLEGSGSPDPVAGDRFRAAVATASIGFLLTLLMTFLVERASRTWAERAAQRLLRLQATTAGAGGDAPSPTTSAGPAGPAVPPGPESEPDVSRLSTAGTVRRG